MSSFGHHFLSDTIHLPMCRIRVIAPPVSQPTPLRIH